VDDLGTCAVQRVDDAIDVRLVARDRVGRDDDDVVPAHLHPLVLVRGHERQRAERLALRPGADDAQLPRCVLRRVRVLDVDDPCGGNVEQPHLACQGHVLRHRAAQERDAASGVEGRLRDLLDAVEMGGKAGHDEPSIAVEPEEVLHDLAHRRLGWRESGAFRVGRVRQQQPNTTVAPGDLAEEGEVRLAPVDGVEVELEVARVEDRARRCEERRRQRVRNGVRHGYELTLEGPDAAALPVADGDELGAVETAGLFDAAPRQPEGQRRAVDRQLDVTEEVRETAGVIFVGVGEDDALDAVGVVTQVREVRQHQVDARHGGIGEHQAAVDDEDATLDFEAEAVPADLAEPAEEDDTHGAAHRAEC
jgi:hypothetical protein